jgi:hypothetical protein
MGAARSFVNELDAQEEAEAEAKEAGEMAVKLMETRFRIFELELDNNLGKAEKMPAHYLITAQKKIIANISTHNDKIAG